MPNISVVMPCLNEEKSIKTCIEKIQKVFKNNKISGEIIVSDNASTDSSVKIAKDLGVKVVNQSIKGYGAAYLQGLKSAKGNYIIIADSDNTYDFLEMPKFIQALDNGYDFVIGSRFKGKMQKGSMKPLHKYIGNPFLNFIFNILYKTNFSDTHSGFRAFTKKGINNLDLKQQGMEFALEMIVKVSKANLKSTEIPVNYYVREGHSKLSSFKDGTRHLSFMLGEWLK
ncbi:MAG: hypothetical protein CL944_01890 [Candidatus Diapherotrites archaeon]|uniref:Glycosyltransferase 2-like domain-containing protein n=1 Tax=Candidatus Iainarchaeum sp. TaxID=3101447 RepID=A0A2D6LPV1_9ARCH|nr:hypothetical protein [Candidatus Diapherotrites archaeon]|tara:strand:+ start:1070 stop:1750 length:681 start_codon:yes stop_codon:yes gene_type:complete